MSLEEEEITHQLLSQEKQTQFGEITLLPNTAEYNN